MVTFTSFYKTIYLSPFFSYLSTIIFSIHFTLFLINIILYYLLT